MQFCYEMDACFGLSEKNLANIQKRPEKAICAIMFLRP